MVQQLFRQYIRFRCLNGLNDLKRLISQFPIIPIIAQTFRESHFMLEKTFETEMVN